MGLIKQDIFPIQIMAHRQTYVKEKTLNNKLVTHDNFVFPSDERNLVKKIIDELWKKHPKDPISVWFLENLNSIFYYVQLVPSWT